MSLGTGAYKVGGAGKCSSMKRRYPWQPCERPLPGTITLNNSVEYLLTNTNLGPVVRIPISANPGLNFNWVSKFLFCSKAFSRIIFSILIRASNHQIVGKKNKTEFAF